MTGKSNEYSEKSCERNRNNKMKFILKAAFAFLFVLSLTSCKFDMDLSPSISGDGNVVTENRNNDMEFTGIEVSRGLDVTVEQSSEQSINIVADKNLLNHISTQIENGILTITSDANIRSATSKKVIVKMPKITSLQASSAASIATVSLIKTTDIGLTTSSAGEINAAIEAENTTVQSSSGSTVKVSGKTLKLDTSGSSGSDLDAGKLLANDVIAESSSGSSIAVSPLVSLKATASSGSNISYHNEPKSIEKHSSSGGSVDKQ